ncbi:MAG: VanZ family protein [Pseudomonadota bacterium]
MYLIAFICYAGLIVFASLVQHGSEGGTHHLDKLFHIVAYGIFAVLGYQALKDKSVYLPLCMAIAAFGAFLELFLAFTPGRNMSGLDMLANAAGVALGAMLMTRKPG